MIKLNKDFLKLPFTINPVGLSLAVLFLLSAYERSIVVMVGDNGIECKRGQFVTTYQNLTTLLNASIAKLRYAMERMKDCGFVTTSTAHNVMIVTVVDYDTYEACSNVEQQTQPMSTDEKGFKYIYKDKPLAFAPFGSTATDLCKEFYKRYKEKFKSEYVPNWGRDINDMKNLLRSVTSSVVIERMVTFFDSTDPFLVSRGYNIPLFKTMFNNFTKKKDYYVSLSDQQKAQQKFEDDRMIH